MTIAINRQIEINYLKDITMKLIKFFKKGKEYQDYSSSEHSEIYEKIARELNSNAQHVYELAHGRKLECYDDYVILSSLLRHGILR